MTVDENVFPYFRLIFSFTHIDKSKVNLAAREARHAKLSPQLSALGKQGKSFQKGWLNRFVSPKKSTTGYQNLAVSKLFKRITSITMAFFVISSFGPLYYLTEGQEGGLNYEDSSADFTEEDTTNILEKMITEDGFLLKPALNNGVSDRSTSNKVFIYQVEPGDTLSSVAQRFSIKKETIVMENNLWNANSLKAGLNIRILPVNGVSHEVKKGETLSQIAKKYGVDEANIRKQNQLEENAVLAASTTLIIPGGRREVVAPTPTYIARSGGTTRSYGSNSPSSPGPGAGVSNPGRLIWPTLGSAKLTQGYKSYHRALDIANRNRGPIYAAAAGRVIKAENSGWNGGYGNVVMIDHGDGMQTLYAHNDKVYVSVGDYVEQGQEIAWMGNTGNVRGATGIHLHFEVKINGVNYNPNNFF